ncbi:M35 family metallo-endopeptidase [Cupriavidus sp. USMAHM13]|uniref:M35 family metallo-endopeptidase n=1 Tax=Cupriavidus sp. USMAHM13 TaxID=1389192 RepID=UPI0018D30E08|nr:M35 family metallo-endopeptidase [Cupriavidus sp. USMAHM13]
MEDLREALRHGDVTSTGGMLTSTVVGFRHEGVPVAAEGDYATCPACKAGGPVQNDAHVPFTLPNGRRLLVRGARVMCQCADKPVVIPSQHHFVVGVGGPGRVYRPAALNAHVPMAAEKLSGDGAGMLVDDAERICPNMSNGDFISMVLRLRDTAVACCVKRLEELHRWEHGDRARVMHWFGVADETIRHHLLDGIPRIERILRELTGDNFVRYSDERMEYIGCTPKTRNNPRVAAAVCAPDTGTHTIAIALNFCALSPYADSVDSQLLTLVHEVSHFHDAMATTDHFYRLYAARREAKEANPQCLENADNVAGYVIV